MSVTVERLTEDDKEQWLELWKGYLEFYKADLPSQVGLETWQRIINPDGDVDAYKAVSADDDMLGMVTYLFHGTTWSSAPRCYLHDLFTVPEARGKGVGRILIEAVYADAADRGADQVYWLTQEFNYQGRILYDKVAERTPFIKYARKV